MEELKARGEQLRRAVRRLGERGPGRRYPTELRNALVRYAMDWRAIGGSLREVSEDVDVATLTLSRWLNEKQHDGAAGFVPIEVVTQAEAGAGAFIVHGPAGIRIEGLGIAELAELLRRLG